MIRRTCKSATFVPVAPVINKSSDAPNARFESLFSSKATGSSPRYLLGLAKGRLDLEIDGQDVDIKNTVGNNWMIPTEAIDKPCLLIASDEKEFLCYFGIIVAHLSYLNPGVNKDGKRSISTEGFSNIYWLLQDEPYPPNFWADIDSETAAYINYGQGIGGTERLRRLFRRVTNRPISRDVIEGVARQKDYMKRMNSFP